MKVGTIGVVALLAMMVPVIAGAQQRVEAASSPDPPPFNTLPEAERLEDGGFTREQASALTKSLVEATRHLATRDDFSMLRAELDRSVATQGQTIIMWLSGVILGTGGLIVAVMLRLK